MDRPPLPPFTAETAAQKARMAEDAWNSRDPAKVALAYTEDSDWRNRSEFFRGRGEIAFNASGPKAAPSISWRARINFHSMQLSRAVIIGANWRDLGEWTSRAGPLLRPGRLRALTVEADAYGSPLRRPPLASRNRSYLSKRAPQLHGPSSAWCSRPSLELLSRRYSPKPHRAPVSAHSRFQEL